MRFDRGLRSTMMKPYPTGHVALSTDGWITEKPSCHWGNIPDKGVWPNAKDLPVMIELQVKLTPIWIEDLTATAALANYLPCFIYPSHSLYASVRVSATGVGFYQNTSGEAKIPFLGKELLDYHLDCSLPFLYEKKFQIQSKSKEISWSMNETTHQTPLWAHGGQQIDDDIHPFVFMLNQTNEQTQLQSIPYFQIHQESVFFQDSFDPDETRTLIQSLEAGMASIHLHLGIDDQGETLKIPYHSYHLSKNFLSFKKGV